MIQQLLTEIQQMLSELRKLISTIGQILNSIRQAEEFYHSREKSAWPFKYGITYTTN